MGYHRLFRSLGRDRFHGIRQIGSQPPDHHAAIQPAPLVQQTYTANDLPATLIDANNNTTSFEYDAFDRLSTITYPLGSTELFTYDADGNVLTRTTRAGDTITFTYDTLNRLSTKTAAAVTSVCSAAPSATPTVTYSYDLAGRLTGVCDNSAAIVAAVPPGGAPSVEYTTSTTYDSVSQPRDVTWSPASAATAPSSSSSVLFSHSYNAVNQRVGQSVDDNTWINYPPLSAGTTSYSANALNQYTAVGGVTPTYDGNGNLTSDGSQSLGYDQENRLVTVGGVPTYSYDAQGRRRSRTVGGVTTIFVSDADGREVLEYDGSTGALQRWYAHGLGPNELLGQMSIAANTRSTPVPDLLGSIVATLDASTGTLANFGYRPFGANGNPPSTFGFTGQRLDPETGLYYYRARHYSPALGRFAQPDPIGYAGGLHLYGYVYNDPLNAFDPYGLRALEAVHTGLAVASFCPSLCGSIFSAVDAAIYLGQGQFVQAGISAAAAVAGVVTDAGAVKAAALGGVAAAGALKTGTSATAKTGVSAEKLVSSVATGAPSGASGGGAYARNSDLVQSIATRAENWGARQGLGNGPVAGTLKHGYADELLTRYQRIFGNRGLSTEVRYSNGQPWQSGMPLSGSVRLDVVEGSLARPSAIFDYKFGGATLSPGRIGQIRGGAGLDSSVPLIMVKP